MKKKSQNQYIFHYILINNIQAAISIVEYFAYNERVIGASPMLLILSYNGIWRNGGVSVLGAEG